MAIVRETCLTWRRRLARRPVKVVTVALTVATAVRRATNTENYQVVHRARAETGCLKKCFRRKGALLLRIVDRDQRTAQPRLLRFKSRIRRHGQPGIGNMRGTDSSDRLVYVVDDDPAVRKTLELILTGVGYRVICFADGPALLHAARAKTPFCILLDVFLGSGSGVDILKRLNARQTYPAPIFVMSGRGTIPLATDSIRNGASDFIEKPFKAMRLIEVMEAGARQFRIANIPPGGDVPLTTRELQILRMVVDGLRNQEIALELLLSPRTVEYHRLNLMHKMHAKNSVELLQMVLTTGPRHRPTNMRECSTRGEV